VKVAEKIERKINRMKEGATFKYQQLGISPTEYTAAAKAIERLIQSGAIKRASTGVFYKPRQTIFGDLLPREEELLKPYLFVEGKRIAYITGVSLYNRLGLTRQVPKTIKVASVVKRVTTKIGEIQVKPIKSYVEVTNDNYYLLELLDALKDFKTIPDLNKETAIIILSRSLENLSDSDKSRTLKYALKYPPRARALLGSLLDNLMKDMVLNNLKISLNPLTFYDLGINKETLPTAPNWNIK